MTIYIPSQLSKLSKLSKLSQLSQLSGECVGVPRHRAGRDPRANVIRVRATQIERMVMAGQVPTGS